MYVLYPSNTHMRSGSVLTLHHATVSLSNYNKLHMKYEPLFTGHRAASASGIIDVTKCCPIPHTAVQPFHLLLPQTFTPSMQVTPVKVCSGSALWAELRLDRSVCSTSSLWSQKRSPYCRNKSIKKPELKEALISIFSLV